MLKGQSTFVVEMLELRNILHRANKNSIVIEQKYVNVTTNRREFVNVTNSPRMYSAVTNRKAISLQWSTAITAYQFV